MSTVVERWAAMRGHLVPLREAPWIGRRNGCGVMLLGVQREVPGTSMKLKGAWVTVLFIPLFPNAFYIVDGGPFEYRFYAEVSVLAFVRLYRWRAISYYFTVLLESVLRAVLVLGTAAIAMGIVYGLFHLLGLR